MPHSNLPHTVYCWKCLTPLMWALLHGAYSVVVEHFDPVVAAHYIAAVMPFPVLSCSLSLGCPLWVVAFEGQSFHQKSQGQTDHTQREMWISVGDPCSSRKDKYNFTSWCNVHHFFCLWAAFVNPTNLRYWAVLVTGGGCGCRPIFRTARWQWRKCKS